LVSRQPINPADAIAGPAAPNGKTALEAQGLDIAGLKYRTRAPSSGESVDDKLLPVEAAEAEAEDCALIADARSRVSRPGGGPRW
jgi:hypothetical protein